jgi:hypothetical protein
LPLKLLLLLLLFMPQQLLQSIHQIFLQTLDMNSTSPEFVSKLRHFQLLWRPIPVSWQRSRHSYDCGDQISSLLTRSSPAKPFFFFVFLFFLFFPQPSPKPKQSVTKNQETLPKCKKLTNEVHATPIHALTRKKNKLSSLSFPVLIRFSSSLLRRIATQFSRERERGHTAGQSAQRQGRTGVRW